MMKNKLKKTNQFSNHRKSNLDKEEGPILIKLKKKRMRIKRKWRSSKIKYRNHKYPLKVKPILTLIQRNMLCLIKKIEMMKKQLFLRISQSKRKQKNTTKIIKRVPSRTTWKLFLPDLVLLQIKIKKLKFLNKVNIALQPKISKLKSLKLKQNLREHRNQTRVEMNCLMIQLII